MTRLSEHAKKRMYERFGFGPAEVSEAGGRLGDSRCYEVVGKADHGGEIRRVQIGDLSISGIVDRGVVVTVFHGDSADHGRRTMTIQDVADAFETPYRTVVNAVNRALPGRIRNGVKTHLIESEVFEVSKELKRPHNSQLASSGKVVTTRLEEDETIFHAMEIMMKRLAVAEPKAALADACIRDEKTQYSITDAGKHLGIRQSEIFAIMRDKRLLTEKNLPSQRAIDYGVLTTKTNTVNGQNFQQAVMTMKNIFEFRRRYLMNKEISA